MGETISERARHWRIDFYSVSNKTFRGCNCLYNPYCYSSLENRKLLQWLCHGVSNAELAGSRTGAALPPPGAFEPMLRFHVSS
jgi:hypothetical protein